MLACQRVPTPYVLTILCHPAKLGNHTHAQRKQDDQGVHSLRRILVHTVRKVAGTLSHLNSVELAAHVAKDELDKREINPRTSIWRFWA